MPGQSNVGPQIRTQTSGDYLVEDIYALAPGRMGICILDLSVMIRALTFGFSV